MHISVSVLLASVTLTLAACGGKPSDATAGEPSPQAAPEASVAETAKTADTHALAEIPHGRWQGTLSLPEKETVDLTFEIRDLNGYTLATIARPGKATTPITNLDLEDGVLSLLFTLDYNGITCELEAGPDGALEGPCKDASLKEGAMQLSPAES